MYQANKKLECSFLTHKHTQGHAYTCTHIHTILLSLRLHILQCTAPWSLTKGHNKSKEDTLGLNGCLHKYNLCCPSKYNFVCIWNLNK